MNGIINVYKEQGFTSHDVVAKLRGILHMKKIGHTGTLDPDAVGVLPVCLGKGTKLCSLITDWGKTYEAVMLLGTTTDTQDITGDILTQQEVSVNEIQVMEAVHSFVGDYSQVPPMYSALKHNGKKLYELARQGIEVERKPRTVHIRSIHVNEMNLKDEKKTVTLTVNCSKGTYIRTLCDDIGKILGCGACMMKLTRTRVGKFMIDESLTLSEIETLMEQGRIEEKLVAVDAVFPDYKKIVVKESEHKLLYNGNKFVQESLETTGVTEFTDMEMFRVYDAFREFVGIYRYEGGIFVPVQMFYAGNEQERQNS